MNPPGVWMRLHNDDDGLTLVELLVTLVIFGILGAVLLQVVDNYARTSTVVRQSTDLNEESRLLLNRMSRELREASGLVAAQNPDGSTYAPGSDVLITFDVDFNGNGTIEPTAPDPERITYLFETANKRVLLQAGGQTLPILAGNVEFLKLGYFSRLYACDANSNGIVTWEEIDSAAAPCPAAAGNSNNVLDDELVSVDSMAIDLTMKIGGRRQVYRTQVALRNRGN